MVWKAMTIITDKSFNQEYLESRERKRFYCLKCFQNSNEKHYLKIVEDETGRAYKCFSCDFFSIDWVFEAYIALKKY